MVTYTAITDWPTHCKIGHSTRHLYTDYSKMCLGLNQSLHLISMILMLLILGTPLKQGGSTRLPANGSKHCYISLDPKPVSRVLVPIDGEGSFLRTTHQLGSHTPNVFIEVFTILHQIFLVYFYVTCPWTPSLSDEC